MNPYFDDRNPMFISQGNSNLESEKSHSFNLSYSMFSMKFNVNISLRHSFGNNGIERVSRLIGKGGEEFLEDIMLPKVHCIALTKISVRTAIQV